MSTEGLKDKSALSLMSAEGSGFEKLETSGCVGLTLHRLVLLLAPSSAAVEIK
jgi:hypothetical protein